MSGDEVGLVQALKGQIVAYETSIEVKNNYICTLKNLIAAKQNHIEKLTELVSALRELDVSNKERIDALSRQVKELGDTLVRAANWIKWRKAADNDGWVPDDRLR